MKKVLVILIFMLMVSFSCADPKIKVAMYGDSLTANKVYTNMLNSQCSSQYYFYNFGVIGETLAKIETRIINDKKYDIYVVWGGINGIMQPSITLKSMDKIFLKLKGKKVYVVSLMPSGNYDKATPDWIDNILYLNKKYKEMSEQYNATYVDIFKMMEDKQYLFCLNFKYTDDGLHLNSCGYKVLVNYLLTNYFGGLRNEKKETK